MHSLQKQFHDFIYTHQLVGKGEKILLAVSGGVDSMVMCSLFRKEQIDFAIAHCNFGLRGLESDGDEALVIEWATQNRVSYFIESFDLTGGSIQLEARNKRYRWFQQLANENGFQKIATAHHLNDSLETILMNLTRGTGYKGIAGIPVATDNIIRPLLFASKKDLIAYAQEDKIAWREDSSNVKDDYGRNRVRHHVIPELEKLNPSLLTSFSLTSERLRYSSSIINERVDKIRDEYFSKEGDSGFKLNLSWLTSGQDLLILSELLSEFDVNYATAKEIYSSIGKSGKTFLTKDWLITMDRGALFFDRNEANSYKEMEIDSEGTYDIGPHTLKVEIISHENLSFESEDIAHFDMGNLRFPLKVRHWRFKDKFQPLGMGGKKLISDFLIDQKVPLNKKKDVLVVESSNEIIWVMGYRISERHKLIDRTKRILKLSKSSK